MSLLLLVIFLGWCSNFVGSESGPKQSVKLLQNIVSLLWERGGEVIEKVEG
jgi:hypothetical protein